MPLKRLSLNATKEARGFEVVAELKSLQELTLPSLYDLTDSEFAAIARLRESPSIERLKVGSRPDFPPREVFWKEFASDARGRQVNADARALCREGKYSVAAQLFRDLLREEPSIATHNAYTWMIYGVVLLASGDISGYQAVCKEMMARFRRRGAGDEVAVRLCLLSPESGVPIQELRRLMPHLALINPNSIYYCRYVVSNGLLEYRAGKTAEAIELLASLEADGFPTALASAAAVLAMAHYQRGELEVAKAQVDYARTIIGSGGSDDWAGLLSAQILLREAEKLVASPAPPRAAK